MVSADKYLLSFAFMSVMGKIVGRRCSTAGFKRAKLALLLLCLPVSGTSICVVTSISSSRVTGKNNTNDDIGRVRGPMCVCECSGMGMRWRHERQKASSRSRQGRMPEISPPLPAAAVNTLLRCRIQSGNNNVAGIHRPAFCSAWSTTMSSCSIITATSGREPHLLPFFPTAATAAAAVARSVQVQPHAGCCLLEK